MTDLFTRLADRARAAGGFGGYGPPVEPEYGPSDVEGTEVDPAVADAGRVEPVGSPAAPAPSSVAVVAANSPEPVRPTASGVVIRESRLLPMPVMVPPSPAAASTADLPAMGREPADARVDPAGKPRPAAVPTVRVERVDRGREILRDNVLRPSPAAREREPRSTSGREPAASAARPIEVTVGRIEVRVRPPARPNADRDRRSIPAPTALTLEEYLRRREASS